MSNVKSGVPRKPFSVSYELYRDWQFPRFPETMQKHYKLVCYHYFLSVGINFKAFKLHELIWITFRQTDWNIVCCVKFCGIPSNNNHLEKGIHRGLLDWHSHYVIFRDQQLSMGPFLLWKKIVRYQENCLIQKLWQCCTSGTSIKFKWCFET